MIEKTHARTKESNMEQMYDGIQIKQEILDQPQIIQHPGVSNAAAVMYPKIITGMKSTRAPSSASLGFRKCQVCEEPASGNFFGALVCLPCKTFFIRCTTEDITTFKCRRNDDCEITGPNRSRCKYCRYRKCVNVGMVRKERPEIVEAVEGQQLCIVCRDIANGIHFGVVSCEGCKKFFRRGLQESDTYICKYNQKCVINPKTRNDCRFCRFRKCLYAGMSRDAIKMGRPRKNSKEMGLLDADSKTSFNAMIGSLHPQFISQIDGKTMSHSAKSKIHSAPYHPYENPHSRPHQHLHHSSHHHHSNINLSQAQQYYYQPLALNRSNNMNQYSSNSKNYFVASYPYSRSNQSIATASYLPSTTSSSSATCISVPQIEIKNEQNYWVERQPNTPGSLSSECSDLSENESNHEEQNSPMNFTMSTIRPDLSSDNQTYEANQVRYDRCRTYSNASSVMSYSEGSPSYNIRTDSEDGTKEVPINNSALLSPPQTPDENVTENKTNDLDCSMTIQEVNNNSDKERVDSPPAELPSKHLDFIKHKFNRSYWPETLNDTMKATLNDKHKDQLNTLVKAYLSFVEEFCKDEKLRDLKHLWNSKDVSEQTLVFQKQVIHQLATVISFVHIIPGFTQVNAEDKYTILRLGTIQLATIVASINLYNPLAHSFIKTFFEEQLSSSSPLFEFRKAILNLAKHVHQLNLDSVEAACLLALLAVASDWPALQCPSSLESVRKDLVESFEAYIIDKYGPSSTRLQDILAIAPQLRELGMWHYRITFELSFME